MESVNSEVQGKHLALLIFSHALTGYFSDQVVLFEINLFMLGSVSDQTQDLPLLPRPPHRSPAPAEH